MKLRKIFAGMAASAVAMTAFAATGISSSALDQEYNAGVAFQTADTWNFRDLYKAELDEAKGEKAVFPAAVVGVQGGSGTKPETKPSGYGYDTAVSVSDVKIQYDGTYTISIAASGTINDDAAVFEDGTDRNGQKWSMAKNTEPDGTEVTSSQFNMIAISTDIPCEVDEDGNAVVDGNVVSVKDITLKSSSNEYTMETAPQKGDSDYVSFMLVNEWGSEEGTLEPESVAIPGEGETLEITFTIEGLGEAPAEESSAAETTESETEATSSAASTTSTSTTTSKASTTSTTATTSTSAGSDKTAESGAAAGIALAGIALAGAAIVVAKKK